MFGCHDSEKEMQNQPSRVLVQNQIIQYSQC